MRGGERRGGKMIKREDHSILNAFCNGRTFAVRMVRFDFRLSTFDFDSLVYLSS